MKRSEGALNYLSGIVGKNKIGIMVLTLLQMILGISSVCFAMLMCGTLDAAAAKQESVFWRTVTALTGLLLLQLFLHWLVRGLEERCRASIENVLKKQLFGCLLRKDYAQVSAIHSGEWMNRLTSDTAITANAMVEILPNMVGMSVKLVGAFVMIVVLEPRFVYMLLPGGVLLIAFTYVFRKVLKRLHKDMQEADGRLRIFLQERLGAMVILRAFGGEENTSKEAVKNLQQHKLARLNKNRFSNGCNIGFSAAMNGMYLFGLAYCGYGILQGTVSYGTLLAILQLLGQIQAPFANLSGFLPKYYAMLASTERLMEAEYFAEAKEKPKMPAEMKRFYEKEFAKLQLEKVCFTYTAQEGTVLSKVSLTIQKGDYVAFTGASGCGKSTLLKLLLSLYVPQSGTIRLQTDSQEKIVLDSRFRRLFAYIPQGNQLMSASIREIVSFSDVVMEGEALAEKEQENRIWRALELACAEYFVRELPEGLDTVLGERGAGLSEGQLQRIAIARAIYADCPILLFDEATSALDEQTELSVLQNLKHMTNKTVLIVTHRPAALQICNRIFEFGESGITEKSR